LKTGAQTIRIMGALGGRLDMTLSNIFLLMLPELEHCDARLEDGLEEVFLIRPGQAGIVEGHPGDIVSLLPWGGPAEGIRTEGLEYPLRGETLLPERTRGLSNVMASTQAQVMLDRGLLVCIHTRKTPLQPKNEEMRK
jgi:thiamine pyrophosphokinase